MTCQYDSMPVSSTIHIKTLFSSGVHYLLLILLKKKKKVIFTQHFNVLTASFSVKFGKTVH